MAPKKKTTPRFFTAHELIGRFGVESDYGRTSLVRAKSLYALGCTRIAMVYCGGHLPTLDRIRQGYAPSFKPGIIETILTLMKEAEDVNSWILTEIDTQYQSSQFVERDCASVLRSDGER